MSNDDFVRSDIQNTQSKVQEYTNFIDQVLRPKLKEAKKLVDEVEFEILEYQKLQTVVRNQQIQDNNKPSSSADNDGVQSKDSTSTSTSTSNKNNNNQDDDSDKLVDLGYQTIYCNAKSDTKSNAQLFINIGLGFHIEMSPKDATEFIKQRILFLQNNKLQPYQKQYIQIQDHLQSSLNILHELELVNR